MFRRSGVLIVFLVIMTLGVGIFNLSAQEKFIADKIVAVIGNSSIMYSEVDMMAKNIQNEYRAAGYTSDRNPYCEALESLLLQRLLYNQAQIDSLDVPLNQIQLQVEQMIQQEVERVGSISAVEALYHKPIFNIREELSAQYKESESAAAMQRDIKSKITVTNNEVERFYKELPKDKIPIIPEQYVYAHIVKLPLSAEEAKFRTRTRLLELRERIINGANFAALARLYSQDPGSSRNGGEMDFAVKEAFVPAFADALSKLKVNQVSEIVETEYGFHIIQLLEVRGNEYRVRHILLKPEYTDEELESTFNMVDTVLNRINSGDITFEEAAALYSDDKYSKYNGGIVSNQEYLEQQGTPYASLTSTRFYKEAVNENDYAVLKDLKIGEISKPFRSEDLKANSIVKVVKLVEIIPAHPATLKDDFNSIEELALQDKQEKEFLKWLDEKVAGMYLRIDDDFKNCDFKYKSFLK